MTNTTPTYAAAGSDCTSLKRRLSLPLLTLYGLGVTVGAGIYVLVGVTAAEAGLYAPISFLLAALVVAFTGFTYAELTTRFPVSAGEAVYVQNGLGSKRLALVVGLMVAASGLVSSAAIAIGASSYLGNFIPLPPFVLAVGIILGLGFASAWGILESVIFASVLTCIEIIGLFVVIYFGFTLKPDLLADIGRLVPPVEIDAWKGIGVAGLLAFFAFVGFEDLANVAEEVVEPRKTMPRAIIATLLISTLLYLAVVSVVVLTVPMETLVVSSAPLDLVFVDAHPSARTSFSLIAATATLNGVLVQMIMVSRVLYGLASDGQLSKRLSYVHPKTGTPMIATALVVLMVLVLALLLPINRLAEMTSQIALVVFAVVNLALLRLKAKRAGTEQDAFTVPFWVPVIGFVTCLLLLLSSFL